MVFLCPFLSVGQIGICIKIIKMDNPNFQASEKKAGAKAASALRSALRSSTIQAFKRRTGELEKNTKVSARYKDGTLDRLVLSAPHYSFKNHFGSTKTGFTGSSKRGPGNVKSFSRKMGDKTVQVKAHTRVGTFVVAHKKNRDYKAYGHISKGLQTTNALEVLATELGENRIVNITSQIDF